MSKSFRRFIARCLVGGVVFAQMATAAYAFDGVPGRAASALASSSAPVNVATGHCAGLASDTTPANVCEVHCTDSVAAPSAPDLPPVSLIALPVDVVPFTALADRVERMRTPLGALSGAPPPTLRFSRLLI